MSLQTVSLEATVEPARPRIVLAASFTVDPLVGSLALFCREAELGLDVEVSPYGQVFQELLDAGRSFSRNIGGVNVVLVRFEDWWRDTQRSNGTPLDLAPILQTATDLAAALRAAANRTPTPILFGVCPPSPTTLAREDERALHSTLHETLASALSGLPNVRLVRADDFEMLGIRAAAVHDPEGDRLGHVPYTDLYFAALGKLVARAASAQRSPPHKVLALDCDNTLWKGVVGEDGVEGIVLSPHYLALQRFALAKKQAGMLLCLVSKNVESDVAEVFRQRADMLLREDDIVSQRVNWLPKSENLRSLAKELNLGLDSFVFIDDNPIECAEVEANCPGVLVLPLPVEDDFPRFLGEVWPLDVLDVTDADRERTELYKQNRERSRFEESATNLADFVAGLGVKVEVAEPAAAEWPRIAQLTQRTNQFNVTTVRRTEAELSQLDAAGKDCRLIRVRDRFGDYGLVGVIIFGAEGDALLVDTLLLSCRVLGRGVEHELVRTLGTVAVERGLGTVVVPFIATKKNLPALRFLDSLEMDKQEAAGHTRYVMPAARAAELAYTPGEDAVELPVESAVVSETTPVRASSRKSVRWNRIAREFDTPHKIIAELSRTPRRARGAASPPPVAPRSSLERRLLQIWAEELQVPDVGIRDDYFELGGTSLDAVRVFARIERELGKQLPLVTVMESPTVEALATRLGKTDERSSLVLLSRGNSEAPPLFLVHDADGETLLYRNLALRLGGTRSVYGIGPRSRGDAPIVHTTIEGMAAHYVSEMRGVRPHGPYLLGGLCAGGVLAFEMARQIEGSGEKARLVAVFDAADVEAPRKAWLDSRRRVNRLLDAFDSSSLQQLPRALAAKARGYLSYQFTSRMNRTLERAAVTTLRLCLERNLPLPPWARNVSVRSVYLAAEARYRPGPALRDEIVLFRATTGEGADEPYVHFYEDPLLGWDARSSGGVKVFDVPGGHGSMLQEPHVACVAENLDRYLADRERA